MPVITSASRQAGRICAGKRWGPGWGGFLSFDFLPDLVKVFCGQEPSDSGTVGVGWGGKCTQSPTRKAFVTVENVGELSK